MNRYQCHKTVEAAKITGITDIYEHRDEGTCTLHLDDGTRVIVKFDWTWRHKVRIGGYFLRYPDGYESFSPPAAFEEGYTLIEGA